MKQRKTAKVAQEDHNGKLAKMAGPKVTRALRAIRNVASLSRYKPTPKQVEAITLAVSNELESMKTRLSFGATSGTEFTLPTDS